MRVPYALRTAISLADRVAPALVARVALYLWCRPGGRRGTGQDAGGTPWTLTVGGGDVVGRTWGSGPRVYLVHGWGGHRGQLAALVEPLVAAGYQVVAHDAPSHGASGPGRFGPRQSTVLEAVDALVAVVAAHGPARAVVAHSLGGNATARAVLDGLRADRVVLVAPMADPVRYTRGFAAALGFGEPTRRRFLTLMQRRVGRPLRDFDIVSAVARHAGALPDGPTADAAMPAALVVHDTLDKETDHDDGARLAAAWPGARLVSTTGLGHRRILRDPDVVAAVVAHVAGTTSAAVPERGGPEVGARSATAR